KVREEAEENDGNAEPGQPLAGDDSQVGLRETKLSAPVAKDVAADRKTHAGGDEREEAGPEEYFFIEIFHRRCMLRRQTLPADRRALPRPVRPRRFASVDFRCWDRSVVTDRTREVKCQKQKNGHGAALHRCSTDGHGSNTWTLIRANPCCICVAQLRGRFLSSPVTCVVIETRYTHLLAKDRRQPHHRRPPRAVLFLSPHALALPAGRLRSAVRFRLGLAAQFALRSGQGARSLPALHRRACLCRGAG